MLLCYLWIFCFDGFFGRNFWTDFFDGFLDRVFGTSFFFWLVLFDKFFLTMFFYDVFFEQVSANKFLAGYFWQVFSSKFFMTSFFWAGVSPKSSNVVYETPFRRGFRNLYMANESDTWILSHFRSILESICTKGKWLSIYLPIWYLEKI